MERIKNLGIIGILFLAFSTAWAAPTALTYQGRILKSDGTPLTYNNVSFIFQITNPAGSCVIYQEQVTGFNMTNSAGVFDVPIGSGTVSFPLGGGFTVVDTFNNTSTFTCGSCTGYTCATGTGTYSPISTDGRLLRVQFYDGAGWKTITPDSIIRSVPFAGFSSSAEKLGNNVASDFLLKAGLPTCTAGTFLSYNGTALSCVAVSGASGGTVTNVSSANTDIGIATGTSTPVLTLNSGTGANQIVKLDASAKLPTVDGSQLTNLQAAQIPNLSAAKITSGVLTVPQGGTGQSTYTDGQLLIGNTATSSLSKATLTAGSGVSIINGNGSITISATGSGGTVTSVTGTAPISVATGASTPMVSLVNGSAAGQVHRWDGTSSWVAAKLNYMDLVNVTAGSPWPVSSCSSGQAVTWSSVSDSFGCSSLSIATSQLTGTLAAAQMPAFTGDVTSSAGSTALTLANSGATAGTYSKVTVDAKGRVTSGTSPTTLSGYGITDAMINLGGSPGVQTGTDASKPVAPSAGTVYFATDTLKIYQFNSGAWATIASANGSGGTITALTSDVSASGSGSVAATVNSVGGSAAANIHSAELAANAATNANTISTIVKRDASGNFSAGTITANLTGNVTGSASLNVLKAGDTMTGNLTFGSNKGNVFTDSGANTVTVQAPTTVSTSYILKLPTSVASSGGQVLTSDTSGNLSWTTPSTTASSYSGVLPIANGGTNSSTALNNNRIMVSSGSAIVEAAGLTNGQLLIGSTGAAPVAASLTAGTGITITPAAGSLTIATTGVQRTSLADGNIWIGQSGTATAVTPSGDATMTNAGVITVTGLRGKTVSATAPSAAGQVLRYDGTSTYIPAFLGLADIRASITPFGGAFASAGCTASQSLYWQSSTDTFQCQSVAIGDAQITYASKTANTFLAAPNGSAGAPTFRGIASADLPTTGANGAYVNGGNSFGAAATLGTNDANTLGIKTNNVTRMTVDTSGNLGIGTTSPSTLDATLNLFPAVIPKLEIMPGVSTGTYQEAMVLRHTNTDGTAVLRRLGFLMKMSSEGSGESIKMAGLVMDTSSAWSNNPYLHLITNDQKRMTITETGNVGIGTTAPASTLNLSSSATTGLFIDSYGGGGNISQLSGRGAQGTVASPTASLIDDRLFFIGGRGYGATGFATAGSSAGMYIKAAENFSDTAQGGYLTFETTPTGSTAASRAERMRITSSGNVGIGTTTPSDRLTVQTATNNYGMTHTDGTVTLGSYVLSGTSAQIGTKSNHRFDIFTNNGGPQLTVATSGNVGIGTTAPRSVLDVNGAILTTTAPLTAAPATNAVDFSTGNLQYTSASCASNFKLNNLKDGGTYTLAVKGTTTGTCSFLAYSDAGTTALTVHMPPDHGPTTSGKHTIYSFMQMGGDLYVSWITGY